MSLWVEKGSPGFQISGGGGLTGEEKSQCFHSNI